jgi:hypothetical protein
MTWIWIQVNQNTFCNYKSWQADNNIRMNQFIKLGSWKACVYTFTFTHKYIKQQKIQEISIQTSHIWVSLANIRSYNSINIYIIICTCSHRNNIKIN